VETLPGLWCDLLFRIPTAFKRKDQAGRFRNLWILGLWSETTFVMRVEGVDDYGNIQETAYFGISSIENSWILDRINESIQGFFTIHTPFDNRLRIVQ
jgi:hypothetical protein